MESVVLDAAAAWMHVTSARSARCYYGVQANADGALIWSTRRGLMMLFNTVATLAAFEFLRRPNLRALAKAGCSVPEPRDISHPHHRAPALWTNPV